MLINNLYPDFGKAGIVFGICIIFAVLASISDSDMKNPLFLFTLIVSISSFVAFVIFLSIAVSALQGT